MEIAGKRTPKIYSSIKTMKKLAEMIRINFSEFWKLTKALFKKNSHISLRTVSFMTFLLAPVPSPGLQPAVTLKTNSLYSWYRKMELNLFQSLIPRKTKTEKICH